MLYALLPYSWWLCSLRLSSIFYYVFFLFGLTYENDYGYVIHVQDNVLWYYFILIVHMWFLCMNYNCLCVYDANMLASYCYVLFFICCVLKLYCDNIDWLRQLICDSVYMIAWHSTKISDCEFIVDYAMVFSLGKGWFQTNRHDLLIFGTCDSHMWTIVRKHAWH